MHPDDLADHQARNRRRILNCVERDATRLAPSLTLIERGELRTLLDAAHAGHVDPNEVRCMVQRRIGALAKSGELAQARRAA